MRKIGLSVIIPLYNAKEWIVPTINHITASLELTNFDAEIIVIDDGSSDGGADAARSVILRDGIRLSVIEQKNTGRYLARKHGVEVSTKDNIMFIDSRVFVDKSSLAFLYEKLKNDSDQIWNGHVNIDKKGNIFARFWDAIVCIAWRRYFRRPKTTSYGLDEFDYYPKGTGFFYVPKARLLAAMEYFEKKTSDLRHSSDDTLLIRYIAKRQRINLSPKFSCLYHNRSTFGGFLKHAYHRGEFFIDGFLRPGTRFFYPILLIFSLNIAIIGVSAFWPIQTIITLFVGMGVFVVSLLIGALGFGVTTKDSLSLAVLGLPFGFVYLIGLWRGLFRKLWV